VYKEQRVRLRRVFSFVALVLFPAHASASGPVDEHHRVLPCRPTVSCTADLVPPGSLEIEAGYLARRVPRAGYVHSQPLLLKLSLLERLQLQAGTNGKVFTTGEVEREARYLDDISIALKPKLLDQTDLLPSVAISVALSIPSWDRHPDFPFAYDASFWGYASKDMGSLHVDINGGVNVWEFDLSPTYQPFATLAFAAPLAGGFGTLLEGYYFADAGKIAPADGGILGGLTYAPRSWLMFDLGLDEGLRVSTRKMSMFVGMTVIPYDFWDTDSEASARALLTRNTRSGPRFSAGGGGAASRTFPSD